MKNKYDRCFFEHEGKYYETDIIKEKLLKLRYDVDILIRGGFKMFNATHGRSISFLAINLSGMNNYWQKYIIDNIFSKVCRETLMIIYVNHLTSCLTKKEYTKVNATMKSFEKSGLIKEIRLSEDKKLFEIKTIDDKCIKFMPALDTVEKVNKFKSECHYATELLIKNSDDRTNLYAVTTVMKNYFNTTYYHSFIVKEGIVYDYAKNIVMSFENYKKLFGCKVIMSIEGKQLLKNIEKLKERNSEFKEDISCDVLKYAMHKQMKKERNMARR